MLDPSTITILPIRREQIDAICPRCWPEEPSAIDALFEYQETLGMAAWEGDSCVAQLHCYRLEPDAGRCPGWPEHSDWWSGLWSDALSESQVSDLSGPAWCLSCYHVGRTLESMADDEPDHRYMGRGIGTRLLMAAVEWAMGGDYAAVLAPGAPPEVPTFAEWYGHMPRTTYEKVGFASLAVEPQVPAWAQGDAPPEVNFQIRSFIDRGGKLKDLRERLMIKRLGS